jgi:hypothetical protein
MRCVRVQDLATLPVLASLELPGWQVQHGPVSAAHLDILATYPALTHLGEPAARTHCAYAVLSPSALMFRPGY